MKTVKKSLMVLVGLALASTLATKAMAQDCCDSCGCEAACEKLVKLICVEKEILVDCYKCECEDIAVPGRSTKCGEDCREVCGCKDGADGCAKTVIFGIWKPGCAAIKTRKKLYRTTVIVKVPSYEWQIIDSCGGCDAMAVDHPVSIDGIPAPPRVSGNVKYDYTAAAHLVAGKPVVEKKVQR